MERLHKAVYRRKRRVTECERMLDRSNTREDRKRASRLLDGARERLAHAKRALSDYHRARYAERVSAAA